MSTLTWITEKELFKVITGVLARVQPGSSLGSNPGFDVSLSPSLLVLAKSIY